MSTSVNKLNNVDIIPVGIDVGSLHARIAIANTVSKENEKDEADRSFATGQGESSTASIIANSSGSRYTIALSVEEPETESDPLNDQYWSNSSNAASGSRKDDNKNNEKADIQYIFGDAARRQLLRQKRPLTDGLVRSLSNQLICDVNNSSEEKVYDESTSEFEDEQSDVQKAKSALAAFYSHLVTQATNSTSAHPSSLRLVLSVPDNASNHLVKTTVQAARDGLMRSMDEVGWEEHPLIAGQNLNKRSKKDIIASLRAQGYVMGVIGEGAAICHAHSLMNVGRDPNLNVDHNGLFHLPDGKQIRVRNILVLNWGASSLTFTRLTRLGSSTTLSTFGHDNVNDNQDLSGVTSYPNLSGNTIKSILIQHVAEQFERKNHIPNGEVLLNKKAKGRLDMACDEALRTLGRSMRTRVTIDGLFEGMDCNIDVMRARFEMLCGDLLRKAERAMYDEHHKVNKYVQYHQQDKSDKSKNVWDVVLSTGSVITMPAAKALIDRVFPSSEKCWRGLSENEVPPEEALAIGCANYASMLVSSTSRELFRNNSQDANSLENEAYCHSVAKEEKVPLCPTSFALSFSSQINENGDLTSMQSDSIIILIEKGTPLPILVTRSVQLKDIGMNKKLKLIQILDDSEEKNMSESIILGCIEEIDDSSSEVELTIGLTDKGKLDVAVNGGPIVTF